MGPVKICLPGKEKACTDRERQRERQTETQREREKILSSDLIYQSTNNRSPFFSDIQPHSKNPNPKKKQKQTQKKRRQKEKRKRKKTRLGKQIQVGEQQESRQTLSETLEMV
jgi:hypothetical protein